MSGSAPLLQTLSMQVPAVAAGATDVTVIGEAQYAGTVTAVTYTAEAAVTGAATNTRTLAVVNRGQAGAGTAEVASLALVAGVNLVAYDERPLTLSGTAANLVVAEGDIIGWTSTFAGTGIADPGGVVAVTISRT